VHPVMSLAKRHNNILLLGAGDGLAARELLKYNDIKKITIVDLDPAITDLFRNNPLLTELNNHALQDKRVRIINEDAWKFLEKSTELYDVVIVDLPDPNDIPVRKLYTRTFYSLIFRHLALDGIVVTQATSPMYAREAFWCIKNTIAATPSRFQLGETLEVLPYHSYVPTFGEWGFVMASARKLDWASIQATVATRYLDAGTLATMTTFAPDMAEVDTELNELHTHKLVKYYEAGWRKWFH